MVEYGIAGMALWVEQLDRMMPGNATNVFHQLYGSAIRIAVIQGIFFWYLIVLVVQQIGEAHDSPAPVLLVALYCHTCSCNQNFGMRAAMWKDSQKGHLKFIIFMDSFVVAFLQFVIGGLFICTSSEVGDIILNAVAVSFISQIDELSLKTGIENLRAAENVLKDEFLEKDSPGFQRSSLCILVPVAHFRRGKKYLVKNYSWRFWFFSIGLLPPAAPLFVGFLYVIGKIVMKL